MSMLLDELKKSWKSIGNEPEPMNSKQFREMMSHSSKSPLRRLRKSMFIEAFIMILCIGLIYALYFSDNYNSSSLALFGLGILTTLWLIVCIYFYSRIYKVSILNEAASISDSLQQKIHSLKTDISFYKNINLIAYLPAVFLGILMGNKSLTNFDAIANSPFQVWIFVFVFALLLFPFYFLFVKFWTQLFYGKYLQELKDMYNEIVSE